ncbi:hypothetical protein ABPG74_008650 [Tetrahymena malaccensis]
MGNNCCFSMKYRIENGEKREILLVEQQSFVEDKQIDLNDSNPLLTNKDHGCSQSSSVQNSSRGYKKNDINTTQNTATDQKSTQACPQSGEVNQNHNQKKACPPIISENQFFSSDKQVFIPGFHEFNEIFQKQASKPLTASEKQIEMEKKLTMLENYINDQQQPENVYMLVQQQPSITNQFNCEKDVDEKSLKYDLPNASPYYKSIESQYFDKYSFDAFLRVIDQMQQNSLKDGSTQSLSTSINQLNTINYEKLVKTYDNGDVYIGNLNEYNQREGYGKLLGSNGIYYEGEWSADKYEGKGTLIEFEKNCVKGNFRNGLPHGNCLQIKLIKKPKECKKRETNDYDLDEWSKKNSLLTINSEFQSFLIIKYKGEFYNGLKQGNGELIIEKVLRYVGGFANDKFEGYGICVYKNGNIYEGQWANDKREGKGSEIWKSGKQYQGEYMNDQFHGYGQLINEQGEIYEGYWYKGEMEGQGILTKPNKNSIYGQWQNGNLVSCVPL